jgi:hypothetical protein
MIGSPVDGTAHIAVLRRQNMGKWQEGEVTKPFPCSLV